MTMRGIRGATTVSENSETAILEATRELLQELEHTNGFHIQDLAAAVFTVTGDLSAAFPARAARELGWVQVPLLDTQQMDVPGSLPRCIRVLLLWNTETSSEAVRHVYLHEARVLRPDLCRNRQQGG